VNYHMISPLSQGKFHRAISHSGALNQCWSDPARKGAALENANKLGTLLNCPTATSEELINCLRNVPATNLTLAISKLYYWDYDPIVVFPPVVEDFPTNEEKFIESRDYNVNSTEIPWLTGMNTEEGLLKLAAIFENENFYNELKEKWNEILPYTFYYHDINASQQAEVTAKINKFYFDIENPIERDTQAVIDVS
jgi:carboxylesterase type B